MNIKILLNNYQPKYMLLIFKNLQIPKKYNKLSEKIMQEIAQLFSAFFCMPACLFIPHHPKRFLGIFP